MNQSFQGIIVPAVTPYKSDHSLDDKGIQSVFSYFDQHPSLDGLFITGATGDYAVLNLEERKRILDIALDMQLEKDWVPNTAAIDEETTLTLTQYAVGRDIRSIGVIIPENCQSFNQVQAFFKKLNRFDVEIFIYQTGNSPYPVSSDELSRLVESANIVGIKDSCSPKDYLRHIQYIENLSDRLTIIQGVEMLYLSSLAMGVGGVIGGGCNIYPQLLKKVKDDYTSGQQKRAMKTQKKVNQYIKTFSEKAMKYFLQLNGVKITTASRKTSIELNEQEQKAIEKIYQELQQPG